MSLLAAPALRVEVEPTQAGFDVDRLARADRYLAGLVDEGELPNSLLVVSRGGNVVHLAAAGQRDAEAGLAVDADTIWRIYSMTKPVTSVAAMMLYEEGAFELSEPVARYLPAFEGVRVYRRGAAATLESVPASEPMRIWHLLTHTAGLTYSFFFNHAVDAAYRAAGFEPYTTLLDPLATVCDRIASLPLLFEPGREWNYSMATDVVGRLVEVVSGKPLDEFFAERIFRPLGMVDTGFWAPPESHSRLAALTTPEPGTGRLVRSPGDTRGRERPVFLSGGGGLVSTAGDYHRFTHMLLNRGELDGVRVLAPRSVELMTRNHLPGGADMDSFGRPLGDTVRPGYGFGLGFQVLIDPVRTRSLSSPGEYGWGGAAGTEFWVDPVEELIVIFFTQRLPANGALRQKLRQIVYQALVD